MLQGEKPGKRLMAAEKPIIKAHHLGDDNIEYYPCPITSMMSMMKNEVLQYRRFEKRVIKGRLTCGDVKTLQGNYSWIPEGWAMEIRAGGEGVKKNIFKFFVHKSSGVRLTNKDDVKVFEEIVRVPKMPPPSKEDGSKLDVSKQDVLLFEEPMKKRKTPRACEDPDALECDTSSQDNMIAQLDFYNERLSAGWVKETYFRPHNKEKTDTYFTDPSSSEYLVFRTKKAATKYFWTGERPKDSWKPTESVTKKYKDLLVADEKDLDGQHEPKEKKPKTTSTEADEAMT